MVYDGRIGITARQTGKRRRGKKEEEEEEAADGLDVGISIFKARPDLAEPICESWKRKREVRSRRRRRKG